MMKRILFLLTLLILLLPASSAFACGGLFCQNSPVDQNAERIIFQQNHDGTITSIIEIQFTGFAEDFSWILPLPSPITADDVQVPETAMNAFNELQAATNPVIIAPPRPDCAIIQQRNFAFGGADVMENSAPLAAEVQVFASGEVGPFGFDVIGAEDPNALILWLRDNNYRVTEEMEPLINVYVAEQFVFMAMRLLPNEQVSAISPVQITYAGTQPMIPLRLTAVAANPNMGVYVWFYADKQAVPSNFAAVDIPDTDLTFFTSGGNNYLQLVGQGADDFGGHGFVTEYAAPAHELGVSDPLLQELARKHAYLTRMYTQISPEEMTVDPVFDYDPQKRDVSNVRDLSGMTGLWDCEKAQATSSQTSFSFFSQVERAENAGNSNNFVSGILTGIGVVIFALLMLGLGLVIGRRR